MSKKEPIWEINLLRAFAILAVLLIHTTSMPLNRLDASSNLYGVYLLLNQFSSFAVPVFLFISGIVLLYTYYDRPCTWTNIGTFYKKRVTSVLLPYLVFSIAYFLLNNYNVPEYLYNPKRFAYLLLTGRAHTHLYFMFIILQFYVLFPIFWAAARKLKGWFPVVAFALQIGYMFFNREVVVHLTSIPAIFHRTGSLSISYFGFFALGGLIGMYYPRWKRYLRPSPEDRRHPIPWGALIVLWLAVGLYQVYIAYRGNVHGIRLSSLTMYWIWFAYNTLSSLALLKLSALGVAKLPVRAVQVLMNLGACAFGIYLIHPMLQWFYRLIPLDNNPLFFHSYFLGMFAVAFFISWAITAWLPKKVRGSVWILGSSPKKVPVEAWRPEANHPSKKRIDKRTRGRSVSG
ncbi:acyltransferase [Gorillibacterium sp. CAU 1737]|uniref:acyltransferase n=1 Tax=Gorillibacterium sp. CAU 1737 TaxID=3140362 RepID=UPI0032600151